MYMYQTFQETPSTMSSGGERLVFCNYGLPGQRVEVKVLRGDHTEQKSIRRVRGCVCSQVKECIVLTICENFFFFFCLYRITWHGSLARRCNCGVNHSSSEHSKRPQTRLPHPRILTILCVIKVLWTILFDFPSPSKLCIKKYFTRGIYHLPVKGESFATISAL